MRGTLNIRKFLKNKYTIFFIYTFFFSMVWGLAVEPPVSLRQSSPYAPSHFIPEPRLRRPSVLDRCFGNSRMPLKPANNGSVIRTSTTWLRIVVCIVLSAERPHTATHFHRTSHPLSGVLNPLVCLYRHPVSTILSIFIVLLYPEVGPRSTHDTLLSTTKTI